MPAPDAPLLVAETARIRRVRDAFDAAGLNLSSMLALCDEKDAARLSYDRREVPRLLRKCPAGEPLGVLARLFLFGVPVAEADAQTVLGESVAEDMLAVGLLGPAAEGGWLGTFRVSPADDDLLVFAEAPWTPYPPPRETQVMSISGSTRVLTRLAIPPSGGSVLEIGTGCGVVAMLAARRADRVLATDFNPRAVNVAAFNAAFNRLDNIEFRTGSLFEPVGAERFDHVLANPPYVMSPPPADGDALTLYRDSGFTADGMSEAVVRGMAKHLKAGGFGHSTINWACVRGHDWRGRLQNWVKDGGCDAWLLRNEILPADRYVARWMPMGSETEFPAYRKRFDEWLAYFDRGGIAQVGDGLITLRKRAGTNWFAEDSVPEQLGQCGPAVSRGFRLRDFLLSRDDEGLLRATYRLAPEARWVQTLAPAARGWSPAGSRLALTTGLGFGLDVDGLGMGVVSRCRGDRALGAVLADLASDMKQDAGKLTAAALPLVRVLVEQGFFLPEGI